MPILTADKIYCQNPSALPEETPAAGIYVQYNPKEGYALKKQLVCFLNGY